MANADAAPVEIDRVEWKGGKKGDGKKGGGKDGSKGKKDGKDGKGKGQGKDLGSKARAKPASLEIAGSVAKQGIWLKTV